MSAWRFAPDFLLRATGFPIERLTAIGDAFPDSALASGSDWEARLTRERHALFAALADDPAREAILTSAPLVDSNFDGWRAHAQAGRRNSQDKKRERVLWRFLQRLTAKNDSTSFFGAVAAGSFESGREGDADAVLPIEAGRRAYTTQWVVERLLQVARAELVAAGLNTPELRRAPGVDGEGRVFEPGARGFREAEGAATTVDFDALPSGLIDPVGEAMARLERQPAGPLRDAWIARFAEVADLRTTFAASAGDVTARRCILAAVDTRLAALMGETARRGDGEFYASRSAVHEQADRTGGSVTLPAAWHTALTAAAAPFLELALLMQAPERVVLRRWFERTFEASKESPVLWRDVLDAIAESPLQLELAAPASVRRAREALKSIRNTLRGQIDRALASDPMAEAVRLDPAEVMPDVAAALTALGPIGRAYANPDFMIALDPAAPELPYRVQPPLPAGPTFILAEAHHLPCLTPCLLPSLALEAPLVARTKALLAELCAPDRPAFPVSYDHSFISVGPDLGAIGLELSGLAKEPPARRATFAELAVYLDGDGTLRFVVPSHTGDLLDVVPLTRTARIHQAAAVFPLSCPDLGRFLAGPDWRAFESLPRLAFGDLVVHRRRFELTPADLPSLSKDAVRTYLAAKAGIAVAPRFMFARMGSEPKPILIDWGSALATELAFWSLTRGETLELSEMSPAPDHCWLRSASGHHTSELRTVLVRG